MRRENKKLKPSNDVCHCECHTDPEVKHPIPCCFECPKCHENIVSHVYNAHVECCSRSDILRKRRAEQAQKKVDDIPQPNVEPKKKRKERLVDRPTLPGSTRSRYRKR